MDVAYSGGRGQYFLLKIYFSTCYIRNNVYSFSSRVCGLDGVCASVCVCVHV